MNVRFLMLVCAAAVAVVRARAEDLSAVYPYQQDPSPFGDPREAEPDTFWGHFNVAFDHRVNGVFEDQFYPFNFDYWNDLRTGQGFNDLSDYNTVVARHAFSDVFRWSARDALLESDLPGMLWLRESRGFLASFLWNSLDSVDEQSVAPREPSYTLVEHSWWKEQSEDGRLRYGVRPFRGDPYAFLGWRIKDAGRVWLLGDVRYYSDYQNLDVHRFELALSVPITRSVSVELGASYQFGTNQPDRSVVLKLLRTLKSGGNLHLALQTGQQPTLIAGITLPL